MSASKDLLLRDVTLHHFKSYGSAVVAGPFDPRQTTIVGPNGAGKSCLIEGICFALGCSAHSSQASLSQLVHRSHTANGTASVAVHFEAPASARLEAPVSARHQQLVHLVVERRIIGGRRSEWRLQECFCCNQENAHPSPLDAHASSPWACSICAVRTIKRDLLREVLQRHLRFDIDRPERLVVHQSTAVAVAQKSPTELLAFLEGVIGTEGLRKNVQTEAARALQLHVTLGEHEQALAAAQLDEGRHAPALLAFRAMEASRARLQAMKAVHLRAEVAYHAAALRASDAGYAELRAALVKHRDETESKSTAMDDAQAAAKAGEQASVKAKAAHALAQRALSRARDEAAQVVLVRKQHTAAEGRAAKARGALLSQLDGREADVRTAQMEQASLLAAGRKLRAQLVHAKRQLGVRESEIDAIEAADAAAPIDDDGTSGDAGAVRGRKRGRGGAERSLTGAPETTSEAALVLRREAELRVLMDAPAAAAHLAAQRRAERVAAERRRRDGAESARLQAARDTAASSLESTRAEGDSQRGALDKASRARSTHVSTALAAEEAAGAKERATDQVHAELCALQSRLDASLASSSSGTRVTAVRMLRSSGDAHARDIYGFLSECLTVSEKHACAVNAALGGALHATLVVRTRRAALHAVRYFTEQRVGVVTCHILEELTEMAPSQPRSSPPGCTPLETCVGCDPTFKPLVSKLLRKWNLAPNSDVALAATRQRVDASSGQRAGRSGAVRADIVTLLGECFIASGEIRQSAPSRATDTLTLAPTLRTLTSPSSSATMRDPPAGGSSAQAVVALSKQVAALQARAEEGSRAARELRAQAAAAARAADDCAARADACETAISRLDAAANMHQRDLEAAEAKLATKSAAIKHAAETERRGGQAGGVNDGGDGGATERIERLQEDAIQLRAALATSTTMVAAADGDGEEEGDGDAVGVAWHVMVETVRLLNEEIETNTRAHDAAERRAREAASAKRSLQTKESALAQQLTTAQRLARDAHEKEGALHTKRTASEASVAQAHAALGERVAEAAAAKEAREACALEASQRKVETLQAERSRAFLRGLCAIDAGLRTTFRALCKHGDCAFEYASQPTILFAEGVRLSVRLPQGEWTRFEGLSGGQQALVAVALNLALREADGAPLVLFDEIDAALDTQRVHALAQYVQRKGGAQTVFVSHRKELIEASGRLLGTYTLDGASQSVSVGFG